MARKAEHELKLPAGVTSPADLGRLIRELAGIDEALLQLGLRQAGKQQGKMPKTSRLMDQAIELNKLNLLHKTDRQALKQFLDDTKAKAPILHVSFSTDPSAAFMEDFLGWLRREIHPKVLVTVGLQPTLGVGCVVRGTNKQFDLSLRQDFANKKDLLRDKLTARQPEAATA